MNTLLFTLMQKHAGSKYVVFITEHIHVNFVQLEWIAMPCKLCAVQTEKTVRLRLFATEYFYSAALMGVPEQV